MATSAKKLLSQLNSLNGKPLEDLAILPSDNPFEINALLFGPAGTPYANGAFKVRLVYGPEYPASPPKGHFLTKIYHPNVSLKGEICVNTLKRDWTADVTISHILMIIKCLLINPGPDSALNEDAGRLLIESYDEFAKMAKMWTNVHAIKTDKALSELDPERRSEVKLSCLTAQTEGVSVLGTGDVNKPGVHGSETAEGVPSIKKVKMAATTMQKKVDAKKKTLKRL
ncbi:protein of unknown function [Taphrina deformans PYCC 5710]|uniref:UBC core domain-containing protein n=1 Tax=Taphrina deformans (strain PYCC 5710 / ATCC 11124 / CBS 356.35 / IMI 108563 / JCM 9778 / NBRC 8474) TaxID=1097556 RepID=R4XLI4_TAPDE|nr:protein of unknown function [Taphrina deformans PYCC 5710]|eukprot:CCG84145.1 protein of unknown function [Taphrina deformans PYCC 5710]